MKRLGDVKSGLDKHAGILVMLIALILLIAVVAIWIVSSAGLEAIRDYGLLIAAIFAFPLGFWRSRVAELQADAAQQTLLNERYQRGAEMLGSEVLGVRLAGIYALESLAKEHPRQYHIQIVNCSAPSCAIRREVKDEKKAKIRLKTYRSQSGLSAPEAELVLNSKGSRTSDWISLGRTLPAPHSWMQI